MVYRLYITNKNYSSWSLRVWLLMRQLDIPFIEEFRPMISGTFSQPQWKEFSPVARVPCLHVLPDNPHTDSEPLILWDSLSITTFLSLSHPEKPIYPSSPQALAWSLSAVAEMHSSFTSLRDHLAMNIGVRVQLSYPLPAGVVNDLQRLNTLWTEGLTRFGGPWLVGKEFSAVDAFYAPVALRLRTYVGLEEEFFSREAKGWVERVLGLESVREWVRDAVGERLREEVHDKESMGGEGRRVLDDLRAK